MKTTYRRTTDRSLRYLSVTAVGWLHLISPPHSLKAHCCLSETCVALWTDWVWLFTAAFNDRK